MFKLMLDEHASKILTLTAERPMNAIELADVLGIPIAACYRRIRMLRGAGMLREDSKVVSIGGKSVATYRSSVESAEVMLQDGRLRVSIRTDVAESSEEVDLEEAGMLHWTVPRAQQPKE
jgi:DNA-binding IclR family transcriptional regulator